MRGRPAERTKASVLYAAIAYCLSGIKVAVGKRHLKPDLTEDQRYAIARKVIDELRRSGWKELDDELPPPPFLTGPSKNLGPGTSGGKPD